jgi:hypothetical protein
MDNYIVRIYRRDADDPAKAVGVVEYVETGTRRSFADIDELLSLLHLRKSGAKNGQNDTAPGKDTSLTTGCGRGKRNHRAGKASAH